MNTPSLLGGPGGNGVAVGVGVGSGVAGVVAVGSGVAGCVAVGSGVPVGVTVAARVDFVEGVDVNVGESVRTGVGAGVGVFRVHAATIIPTVPLRVTTRNARRLIEALRGNSSSCCTAGSDRLWLCLRFGIGSAWPLPADPQMSRTGGAKHRGAIIPPAPALPNPPDSRSNSDRRTAGRIGYRALSG